MTAIRVDNSHPVPAVRRGKRAKYPFETMQPGQSFAIPMNGQPLELVRNRLMNSLCGLRRRKNIEGYFITKKIGDDVRCWRVR